MTAREGAEPGPIAPAEPAAGGRATDRARTAVSTAPRDDLTPEQRRIVEWEDGPLVVIAAAGTGKTKVIVERVRRLLERHGSSSAPDGSVAPPEAAAVDPDDPFAGPLLPEQILVLTYNVRAAAELGERIERSLGSSVRARMTVSNFHQFCHRILTESAADIGLPAVVDLLDGVGQLLLLRELRPSLALHYYGAGKNPYWGLEGLVGFINRAKDELVGPDDVDAFVARERAAFEARYGSWHDSLERLGVEVAAEEPVKKTQGAYAKYRAAARAEERGDDSAEADFERVEKAADAEARTTISGTGRRILRKQLTPVQAERVAELTDRYLEEGAALEVLRLADLALVYRAYEERRQELGAVDFGEQIRLVVALFRTRPNVLRAWQRRYRYLLVDEFQDANIAQIELIELLGRTPDRPANVMVVGDDDQSIYRFRGSSYAAFEVFDDHFARPPLHAPETPPPGRPPHLRIERNFRSLRPILEVANRLIARNELRYLSDKVLVPYREGPAKPVELVVCAGADDEAAAIVERIRAVVGPESDEGADPAIPWGSFTVLYRKHSHREAIESRLRAEGIPYTVIGGSSLFRAPEIRDLECALRAIADPYADPELTRVLTSGPWRLDALELLPLTSAAKRLGVHVVELVRSAAEGGEVVVDAVPSVEPPEGEIDETAEAGAPGASGTGASGPGAATGVAARTVVLEPATRAKLRRFLEALEACSAEAAREGPFTVLERYLEATATVLDLIAVDTLESRRKVANIASLMRFASDWQLEHPNRTLLDFVGYLDAYQSAGGNLETSVEMSDDANGVRLMTLYQAKGLEYPFVFVPFLLEGEWPVTERGGGLFPPELLREPIPVGAVHTEEERRLLYVALTRARDGLVVTTHAGPTAGKKKPSPFVGELLDGAGPELTLVARPGTGDDWLEGSAAGAAVGDDEMEGASGAGATDEDDGAEDAIASFLPPPNPRERRTFLRVRATELLGLLEGLDPTAPETGSAQEGLLAELRRVGEAVLDAADAARARGLDPVTLRTVTSDPMSGATLLSVVPLPPRFSYTAFSAYEACPARYAFQYLYRIPSERRVGALAFGSSAHAAFERFTKERRERAGRGEAPPSLADLERIFREEWRPEGFPDRATESTYRNRTGQLLRNFYEGELARSAEVEAEELAFTLVIDPGDGSSAVRVSGSIDRLERTESGGLEIVDYKTGSPASQKSVDENLQLSIYALACRDALGRGTPERVTLYFTETGARISTVRSDEQLEAARADIVARAGRIRSGDFTATPSKQACGRCDFRALCPSRAD